MKKESHSRFFLESISASRGRPGKFYPDLAHDRFFEAVDKLAPQVHGTLRDEVWPAFKEALSVLRERMPPDAPQQRGGVALHRLLGFRDDSNSSWGGYQAHNAFVEWYFAARSDDDPAVQMVKAALAGWADRYNLQTRG